MWEHTASQGHCLLQQQWGHPFYCIPPMTLCVKHPSRALLPDTSLLPWIYLTSCNVYMCRQHGHAQQASHVYPIETDFEFSSDSITCMVPPSVTAVYRNTRKDIQTHTHFFCVCVQVSPIAASKYTLVDRKTVAWCRLTFSHRVKMRVCVFWVFEHVYSVT